MTKFFESITKRKSPDEMIAKSQVDGLKKTLGWFDLIILGVSAVIGSGIFVMIGEAACGTSEHIGAGPSLVVSIVAAALACIFPAFCYAEFAAAIPVAGGAYTYTYATLGEFAAWMMGWVLMLEYAVSNITVAAAWTGYLFQLIKGFENVLPNWIVNPPLWLIHDFNTASEKYIAAGADPTTSIPHILGVPISFNLPGILVMLGIAFILMKGMQESTKFAKIMVYVKIAVILLFAGVGFFYVKPSNWVPFAPGGFEGILLGTFIIFYAYLGFDTIATAAEETKEPQKNIPIGIIGTLLICSAVYAIVAIVFTGVIPSSDYGMIDLHAPIAHVTRLIHQDWISGWISVGALAGLTSVLLVLQFIIFYAYLGFDTIATAAEETKEPQKNIPIGIIGTLLICSAVYAIVAIVFTGVIPSSDYGMIDLHAPIAHVTRLIHQDWISGWISVGALAGLTSVLLVLQYATSRILYAMARDNFLPKILRLKHPQYKTPYIISWTAVVLVIIGSLFIDMSVAAQLCIFGTLTSFILVCLGVLIMRKIDPDRPRPFKVPFCPWFPIAGILICSFLMVKAMPQLEKSAALFPLWLLIGAAIYFYYGYKRNRAEEDKKIMLNERFLKKQEELTKQ